MAKERNKRAVLIAGPTASGKTALAITMARARGARIVNADSMQVYGVLDRLTARHGWQATPEMLNELMASYHGNMREMLFHLYDVVELQRQQQQH